jgi:hypothetical protein
VSVSVLHLIPDDCWDWLRHGCKRCGIWLSQSISRYPFQPDDSTALLMGHFNNIVNCWHQRRSVDSTVMFKWRKLFDCCTSWINVGGEMRFDSWCWSAHFHLNINDKLAILRAGFLHLNVSPFIPKGIGRLLLFRFYFREQCRNIGRFFLTIVLFPLLMISAKTQGNWIPFHCR